MRISDWSSDVCSSDLQRTPAGRRARMVLAVVGRLHERPEPDAGAVAQVGQHKRPAVEKRRSEEHTSELQSLMRISYAVFCLKKKKTFEKKYLLDQLTGLHASK